MNASMIDILWIVVASGLVFIMQAGFAMLESGLTRSKNSINVAMKNLTDLGVSLFLYWFFGFAIMFGASWNGIAGTSLFAAHPSTAWVAAFLLFQSMFCSTAATIVSGAVAERMRYSSYIIATIIVAAIIYPVFGHWAWGGALTGESSGWLAQLGFIDFAGSTVVHSVGGWMALASVIVIGPRLGRFDDNGKPRQIQGSNLTLAVLGVILLWFGWFGFNGGSTLAMNTSVAGIILRTSLATAAGMIAALALGWPLYKRPDVSLILNGSLAGLVAITAPVHAVNSLDSILIGAIGGIIMLGATHLLERLRIDDAVGAIPVHLAAGIWGTLAVALFGDPEIIGNPMFQQLGIQALGIVTCGLWSFGVAWLLLIFINRITPLRVTPEEEQNGLNYSEHRATTEMHNLFMVMERQAHSADLSLRVPVDPFTDAGQIALRYNNVLDRLESSLDEKEKEAAARLASESRYRALVDSSDVIIFSMNPDLTLKTINHAVKKHFKIDPDELGGLSLPNLLYREQHESGLELQMLDEKMKQLEKSGKPVTFSARFKSPKNIEPVELQLRLEKVEIQGQEEILGRGYRVTDDALNRYLNFERQRFSIENMLMVADDITHRITRSLRRFFEGEQITQIRIALREILINAIEHGNLGITFEEKTQLMIEDNYYSFIASRQRDPQYRDKRVEIEYMIKENEAVYRITDEGKGFDHRKAMEGAAEEAQELMLSHGRGLRMVQSVFDEIRFNKKGNQVLLVKALPAS